MSLLLAGCETSPTLQSVKDIGKYFSPWSSTTPAAPVLNPAYRYLRIQTGKRVAYFALGYVDTLPEGKVEVWYSGGKEVLKLLDGRLVGMVGTATEWLSVKLISPPAWGDQARWYGIRETAGYQPGVPLRGEGAFAPEAAPAAERYKAGGPEASGSSLV